MLSAEAYAKMNIAIYEARLVAWYGKYTYNVIRPITYIQKNIMNIWVPVIETPPHPEFPAAHPVLSSATAAALTNTLGKISFKDAAYADLGMKAYSFSSFEDAGKEAGISRLYEGIHHRFSIDEGLAIGKRTANEMLRGLKFLK